MSEEKSKVTAGENFIITEQALSIIIATLEKMPYKEVEHILVPLKHQPGFIAKLADFEKTIIENYEKEQELLKAAEKKPTK